MPGTFSEILQKGNSVKSARIVYTSCTRWKINPYITSDRCLCPSASGNVRTRWKGSWLLSLALLQMCYRWNKPRQTSTLPRTLLSQAYHGVCTRWKKDNLPWSLAPAPERTWACSRHHEARPPASQHTPSDPHLAAETGTSPKSPRKLIPFAMCTPFWIIVV